MVRVVAEKGYETATVADAVKLARVSRGTFYELFGSHSFALSVMDTWTSASQGVVDAVVYGFTPAVRVCVINEYRKWRRLPPLPHADQDAVES